MDDQIYNPTTPETLAPAASLDYSWAGLVGTVVLFLALLIMALWMIRRFQGMGLRALSAPWARVLDRQMISNQLTLYLVEIAGKLQVLAVTDHHVTVVQEIQDPDAVAEILDEIANRPPEKMERLFVKGLSTLWGKRRKRQDFDDELKRLLEEVQK